MSEVLKYVVKPGRRFGSFFEHGPGSIVELTEAQAGGFPDTLELVKEDSEPAPESEKEYLQTLTVKQLVQFPEYEKIPAPKPTVKDELIDAILEVRRGAEGSEDTFNQSFNNDLVLESMTKAELMDLPEWDLVEEPKPTLKADILDAIRLVRESA